MEQNVRAQDIAAGRRRAARSWMSDLQVFHRTYTQTDPQLTLKTKKKNKNID